MDNGEPLPSYEGIAAEFAKAKAEKEKQESQGLKPTTVDAAKANKQGEVHFKAAHGILVAFFTWILYNCPWQCANWGRADKLQCPPCFGHLPLHERLPPHEVGPGRQVGVFRTASR